MKKNYDELKKLEEQVDENQKRDESENKLSLMRLELLYQNHQELEQYSLMEDSLSEEDEKTYLFRESLQAHYAKRDGIPSYIKDLHLRYRNENHQKLLPLEIDYLVGIQNHYRTFSPDKNEHPDIPNLIDDIIRR